MDAAEFFNALFADAAGPEARIAVWTLPDKKVNWSDDAVDAAAYAGYAVDAVKTKSHPGGYDVYFGVGLYRPGITKGRGKADDVVCITALWADLDFGEGHKKTNLPPDEDAARKILERLGLKPSLIVHSGHGLQPYWLLQEPVTAQEGAARLAGRWGATIQAHARVLGYAVDSVWDLARVLRVPETYNRKAEPVLVRCEGDAGLRYDVGDLEAVCVVEDYADHNPNAIVTLDALTAPKAEDALAVQSRIDKACQVDRRFKNTWERKRADLSSASEYDLSLADQAFAAGWADQDVTALLLAWRAKHGEQPEKLERLDYLQRTLGKAKEEFVTDRAIGEVKLGVEKPEPGNPDDPRRQKVLDTLSKALCVPVGRWVQVGTEDPEYALILIDGTRIVFDSTRQYRSQDRFADRILEVRQVLPRRVKGAIWDKLVALLASIVEVEEDPEGNRANQAVAWIETYLRTFPAPHTDTDDAIASRGPLIRNERLHVIPDEVLKIVNQHATPRVKARELRSALRAAGFVTTPVSPVDREDLKCTRFWRDNAGVYEAVVKVRPANVKLAEEPTDAA